MLAPGAGSLAQTRQATFFSRTCHIRHPARTVAPAPKPAGRGWLFRSQRWGPGISGRRCHLHPKSPARRSPEAIPDRGRWSLAVVLATAMLHRPGSGPGAAAAARGRGRSGARKGTRSPALSAPGARWVLAWIQAACRESELAYACCESTVSTPVWCRGAGRNNSIGGDRFRLWWSNQGKRAEGCGCDLVNPVAANQ